MLRLRLQRRGKRNYATYRVVVADQRAPIKGKFVADVGWYNPHHNEFKVNAEDVKAWLKQGVQPTPTVHNLLIENKVIKGDKATSWRPKVKKSEGSESSGSSQLSDKTNQEKANEDALAKDEKPADPKKAE